MIHRHSRRPGRKKPVLSQHIEFVDEENRPLGVLPENEVHRQGLLHRSVQVLVFDKAHRLLIRKRQGNRNLYPGRWDLSASGHVLAGESAADAACRKLEQELGITPAGLRLVMALKGTPVTSFEFVYLFNAGKILTFPSSSQVQMEDTAYLDRDDMSSLAAEYPDILTPGLVYLWRKQLLFPRL